MDGKQETLLTMDVTEMARLGFLLKQAVYAGWAARDCFGVDSYLLAAAGPEDELLLLEVRAAQAKVKVFDARKRAEAYGAGLPMVLSRLEQAYRLEQTHESVAKALELRKEEDLEIEMQEPSACYLQPPAMVLETREKLLALALEKLEEYKGRG